MKKTFTTLFLLTLITATTGFSQNLVRILNPNWWDFEGTPGSITEATFTVQPQGAYIDIGMYLTITDETTGYLESEWLEAVMDFNLPEGSIVYDSWLWMMDDTTIVKADVLDIWSATQDYNAIVDRQSDPSILYRKANGSHQIRIYPVPGSGSRKVKISYLVPAIWSAEDVSTWLPLDILTASHNPLEEFRILTFPDSTWANPRFEGLPGVAFQNAQDATFGNILLADLQMSYIEKPFRFAVDAPLNSDGVFAQKLEDGMDQFYQLVYMPPIIPEVTVPKKLIFLFDHEDGQTKVDRAEFLKNFKETCLTYLKEEDQISLAFSTADGTNFFSDTLVNADTTTITSAYEEVNSFLTSYSDVLQLVEDGVSFILENGGEGDLVLFASSDEVYWWQDNRDRRDTLYQRILENDIKIHIVNYQDNGFYYETVWQGPDFWTYQNQEFYHELTEISSGNMYGSLEGSSIVWESMASLFNRLKSEEHDFDLHTSLNSGFTYDRFEQSYLGQSENVNRPILQIGKYVGDFPLELEYSSFTDSTFIFENVTVDPSDIYQADTLTREIWFGHHLREMEGLAVASNSVQEVIDLSIEERVLTKFTAFLALDLEQGAEPCLGCWEFDGDILIFATDDLDEEEEIQMSAFPNPFKDAVTIDLKIKEGFKINEATIRIVDAFGKNILTQGLSELVAAKQTQWQWNGRDASGNSIAAGVYFVILQTDKGVGTVKLTMVK